MTSLIRQQEKETGDKQHTREFGGFKRDLRWLVAWLQRYGVELVVMENTGIYWKSLYSHLERGGIETWVVNAHHIKQVPGRKTDLGDAHWLAELGRFGLVRGSFIPPQSCGSPLTASHLFLLESLQGHIRQLEAQLGELDSYLIAAMAPYRWAWELLQTIPGIDAIAAALILVEIGTDMSRFGSADCLASWAALCPGNHESAGKR
jgi:transposase